jgi:hypothetical protein
VLFVAALLPALGAIWATPWFITQDGPAHLYNAHIIARSGDPHSPFRGVYQVRWSPLPNWAGHLSLVALLSLVPPRTADRLMTSLTLVGFAASIVWLRWRVVGWRGMPLAALMAAALAINLPWLLGFTSFLLGACLFPITLGLWWHRRDRLWPGGVVALWALTILGYFSHLVSLALTMVALAVLAVLAPGPRRVARVGWTALGVLPLAPLAAIYLSLTRQGGPMQPEWAHLADPFSPASWLTQLAWADPITLARKVVLPFRARPSAGFLALAPVVWFAVALVLQVIATVWSRYRERGAAASWPARRGWPVAAAVLVLGGVAGPDTLGASHGNYLPQRVLLFGLAALVPVLDLEFRGWLGRASAVALAVTLAIQSAFLWEYAASASRNVGALMSAGPAVGRNQRVATLLAGIRGRFRANPLLHADNLLGVGTGNILWSNYETRHYYFPVQFRNETDRPDAATLEHVALRDDPKDARARARLWRRLLEAHHRSIDVVLAWGRDPDLDQATTRWFVPVYEGDGGQVRVFRHR